MQDEFPPVPTTEIPVMPAVPNTSDRSQVRREKSKKPVKQKMEAKVKDGGNVGSCCNFAKCQSQSKQDLILNRLQDIRIH